MNAEIVAVGTELLHGDISNTNAQYISKELAKIGVDVHYHSTVGDNPDRIKSVFEIAIKRAEIIIVTGGLGPTKDDITKETLAEYLGLSMEYSQESFDRMKDRFESRNRIMTENNLRQVYFPKGAIVIPNKNGTADACRVDYGDKSIYLLPGPPIENQPIVDEVIIPQLSKKSGKTVAFHKIEVFNLGESTSETMLMDIIDGQTNPTIAPYAGNGRLIYRITSKANSIEEAEKMMQPMIEKVLKRLGENAKLLEE